MLCLMCVPSPSLLEPTIGRKKAMKELAESREAYLADGDDSNEREVRRNSGVKFCVRIMLF